MSLRLRGGLGRSITYQRKAALAKLLRRRMTASPSLAAVTFSKEARSLHELAEHESPLVSRALPR